MSYAFHITRRSNWSDDDGATIDTGEWLALASSIDQMAPVSQTTVTDRELKLPPEWHSHRCQAHPQYRGNGPTFQLCGGNVDFSAGDPATMGFALQIARALNARIVGDEGEAYTLNEVVGAAGDLSSDPSNPFTREPIYAQREGVLQLRDEEWHLTARRRALLGLLSREERVLLQFIVPAPEPSTRLHGGRIRVRGSLSERGSYGSDGSCGNVLYVLNVIEFAPASQ